MSLGRVQSKYMARRGFSCPNCHTWFEGEGNHPKCPVCGTRASPRDLLDDRQAHRPAWEAYETATAGNQEPRRYEATRDYETPQETAHDYEVARDLPADYDVPKEEPSEYETPWQLPSDYEVPREIPHGFEVPRDVPQDYDVPQDHEEPAYSSGEPSPAEQSGKSLWDRLSPLIGVAIFLIIIASRVCGSS